MRVALSPHPDFPCVAVSRLEVEVARRGETLSLDYRLTGQTADLAIPPPALGVRTDELWRHTCFEAFVRPGRGEAYLELNLSPSTEWAAYRFTNYRAGMAPADVAAPRIDVRSEVDLLTLTATVDLARLSDDAAGPWRLALTAVIEDQAGGKSYWSLAHPEGRPDFHHAAGFVLDL